MDVPDVMIGTDFLAWRKHIGIDQRTAGQLLGALSQQYISRLEHRTTPIPRMVATMCWLLTHRNLKTMIAQRHGVTLKG